MKWKFILPVVASIIVVLGLSGTYKGISDARKLHAELGKKIGSLLEIGSLGMTDPVWNLRNEIIKDNAESLLKDNDIGAVEVLDAEGKILYSREKKEAAYEKGHLLQAQINDLVKDKQKIGSIAIRPTVYFVKEQIFRNLLSIIMEILVTVVVLGSMVFYISMKLSKPVLGMASVLKDISEGEGDLTKTVTVAGNDEIGEMAKYFNRFIDKLNAIVVDVKGYSRSIAVGTGELTKRMDEIGSTEQMLLDTAAAPKSGRPPD
jgi:methyl-accepting chemotaxis protein